MTSTRTKVPGDSLAIRVARVTPFIDDQYAVRTLVNDQTWHPDRGCPEPDNLSVEFDRVRLGPRMRRPQLAGIDIANVGRHCRPVARQAGLGLTCTYSRSGAASKYLNSAGHNHPSSP